MKTKSILLCILLLALIVNSGQILGQSCSDCTAVNALDVTTNPACSSTTSYGTVDPGLEMWTIFRLSNCTGASINIEPSVVYAPPGTANQWDFNDFFVSVDGTGNFSLPPGDHEYTIKFNPTNAASNYTATLTLGFDDSNYGARDYNYTFSGACAVVGLNAALVLDRSGSMNDPAFTMGTTKKIEALQRATALFYDALRPEDSFGVVKYNNVAEDYLGFAAKSSYTSFPTDLDAGATTDMAKLKPWNGTAIGKGLTNAIAMLNGKPVGVDRKNIIILQTDGIENVTPPPAATVTPPANVNVYTIGLGPDSQDGLLQTISTNSNVETGFLKVNDEAEADMKLQSFYHKILCQAHNNSMVVDPIQTFNLAIKDSLIAFMASMTSSDIEAEFLLIDNPILRKKYKVDLLNPEGKVVQAGTMIAGQPVEVFSRFNYTLYRVNGRNVNADNSATFRGMWRVAVTTFGECAAEEVCTVPISFSASAKSNIKMKLSTLSGTYLPGSEIVISAELTERMLPIASASVMAEVRTPDKSRYVVKLRDDGLGKDGVKQDGIFTATFTATSVAGTYQFAVQSTVRNAAKEVTNREEIRYVSLLFPVDKDVTKCCDRARCIWYLVIVSISFIIVIFLFFWFKRRINLPGVPRGN